MTDVYPNSPTIQISVKMERPAPEIKEGEEGGVNTDTKLDELMNSGLFEGVDREFIRGRFESVIESTDNIEEIKNKIISSVKNPTHLNQYTLYYNDGKIVNLLNYLRQIAGEGAEEKIGEDGKSILLEGDKNVKASIVQTMDGHIIKIEIIAKDGNQSVVDVLNVLKDAFNIEVRDEDGDEIRDDDGYPKYTSELVDLLDDSEGSQSFIEELSKFNENTPDLSNKLKRAISVIETLLTRYRMSSENDKSLIDSIMGKIKSAYSIENDSDIVQQLKDLLQGNNCIRM